MDSRWKEMKQKEEDIFNCKMKRLKDTRMKESKKEKIIQSYIQKYRITKKEE